VAIRHWLQLSLASGIGPILIRRLIETAGGAEAAAVANVALLRRVDGIGNIKSNQVFDALRSAGNEVEAEMARCAEKGIRLICPDDQVYPPTLKMIPDPPPVLYVNGTLEPRDLNAVAIVGSRNCSHYGREQADRFGALLAGAGVTVISGGARGIDSAAHRGALAHPLGRTIAVLGCGVDQVYPPENTSLFEQIAARGAVISEFPLGSPPLRENFPRRNRIVSGMSRGVLVIEADIKSGALITARQANDDHGRPVFALPGRVDNPLSAGPHELIRDGAVIVTKLEDILDGLGPLPENVNAPMPAPVAERDGNDDDGDSLFNEETPAPPPAPPLVRTISGLSDRQKQLIAAIDDNPTDVDAIVTASGLPPEVVLQELTLLTLRGAVKRVSGQTYVKRPMA
jgi:DNA processing protein